ncbi:MAG: hypothetical protein ACTSQI_21155 [Candidatus Helarchaeota archaeon]
MNKNVIGWVLILIGIGAALVGTWFYQSALSGVMTQINMGNYVEATIIYLPNMQLMGIMVISGVLLVMSITSNNWCRTYAFQ